MDLAPRLRPVLLTVLAALAQAGLSACGGSVSPGGNTGGAQGVTVEVQPSTARVPPGGTQKFASAVTGTADIAVVWQVVDAGGGTVDVTGLYVAPGTPGTYRVRASSHADPTVSGTATVTVTAPVTVAISPKTTTVAASGTVAFSATVGSASNTSVTWSVLEASGCGSVTQAGVYTAPAAGATCHVVATSVADTSKSDTATVTVTPPPPPPPVVTIAPSPAAVNSCKSLTFTATVTGATNTSVTWSVQEAAGGTISSAGVYTAPSTAGTYHVVATTVATPTTSASVPVTVTDKILSVAVSPLATTATTSGSVQFAATVTTTCGSYPAN
jgi:hypothetical protein